MQSNVCSRINNESVLVFLLFAGTILLGATFRLYDLGRDSLWGDEAHTAIVSSSPRTIVLTWKLAPLYLITYFLLPIGENEFIIRLPHAMLGILSIALIYKVGEVYLGKREGLIGAFLLAISPFHIQYSQDARYYALMIFLSLLPLLFLRKGPDRNKRKWHIAFILTSILNIHNHPFAFIIVGAQVIYACLIWRWTVSQRSLGEFFNFKSILPRKVLVFLIPLGLVLISLNPLVWRHLIPRVGGESKSLFGLELNVSFFHDLLVWLGAGSGLPLYIYLLLFILGLIATWVYRREAFVLLITVFLFTLAALQLLVLVGPSHRFYLRYIIFLLPFYLLAVASGLGLIVRGIFFLLRQITGVSGREARSMWATGLSLALTIVIFVPLAQTAIQNHYLSQIANYSVAIDYLAQHALPGDVIAVLPFRVKGHRAGLKWYYERNEDLKAKSSLVVVDIFDSISALLDEHQQIWFVDIEPLNSGYKSDISDMKSWIEENSAETERLANLVASPNLGLPMVENEIVIYRYVAGE